MKKKKRNLPAIENSSPLEAISLDSIGTNGDPCFGKGYDLSTSECKICGDSELCCIKFSNLMGKTRQELEKEAQYKDLDVLVDFTAAKKTFRALQRKGTPKKEILDKLQKKYELTRQEVRALYRSFNQ